MDKIVIVFICFFVATSYSAKFPAEVPKCHYGDSECILNIANSIVSEKPKGFSAINLFSVDPLHIDQIALKQGATSPVNIELTFNNVDLIGIQQTKFYSISGFQSDPNGQYEMRLKGPALYLIGPYKISGRVLILPIQGEGKSNLTLVAPDLLIRFNGKSFTKNGKEYLSINDLKLTFTCDRISMRLDNLYNGDKVLGESTNLFLNENWREIFKELEKSIFDAFSLIVENTLSNVFKKFPYKELFAN